MESGEAGKGAIECEDERCKRPGALVLYGVATVKWPVI
jgi:hypothetical protein